MQVFLLFSSDPWGYQIAIKSSNTLSYHTASIQAVAAQKIQSAIVTALYSHSQFTSQLQLPLHSLVSYYSHHYTAQSAIVTALYSHSQFSQLQLPQHSLVSYYSHHYTAQSAVVTALHSHSQLSQLQSQHCTAIVSLVSHSYHCIATVNYSHHCTAIYH